MEALREESDRNEITPRLTAVIETVNVPPGDLEELFTTLDALDAQSMPRAEFEVVVVVDPDVHPGLAASLADRSPPVRVVAAPGRWYYEQKNIGAHAARADIVAFVDSDNAPVPTWAETIEREFRADADLGALQGVIRGEPGVLGAAFQVTIFPHLQTDVPTEIASIGASNVSFRRAELLASPWHEAPMKHGPDLRMAAAQRRAGKTILLAPGAATRHAFVESLPLFLQRGVYWGYCFIAARRPGGPIRYARAVRRTGALAPFLLAPAKALLDIVRLWRGRRGLGLSPAKAVASSAVLVLNAVAVGIGAMKAVRGAEIPPSPY